MSDIPDEPTRPLHRTRRLRLGRRDWATIAIAVIGALLFAWGSHQIRTIRAQNNALANALSAQRQQTQNLGAKPVAPPPAVILKDPSATMGPPGPPGTNGAAGPAGRGISSLACTNGRWRVEYTDGTVDSPAGACMGLPGQIGATGAAGVNGADGSDGQPGAAGADGQPGAVGPSGPPGAPGADGKDGAAGQPPASWTWTSPLGLKYTCTRNPDSPDSAPTYACTAA